MTIPRHIHARPDITDINCAAIQFTFIRNSQLVVWRDGGCNLKPPEGKRVRDIQPGDEVEVFGEMRTVEEVELYR